MNHLSNPSSEADSVADDPKFSALFAGGPGLYAPVNNAKGRPGVEGQKIHGILIPSNKGSSRGGKNDTTEGPAYIWEKLSATLRAGGADVTFEVVPVEKLTGHIPYDNQSSVKNSNKLVPLFRHCIDKVCNAHTNGQLPIVLGGDHTSALAAAGTAKMHSDPKDPHFTKAKVVLKDGDCDYLGNPHMPQLNGHGRTFSTLQGFGPDEFMPIMEGIPRFRPNNTLFVGGFRPDKPEVEDIIKRGCVHLGPEALLKYPQLVEQFLTAFIGHGPYHGSHDLDVLAKNQLMTVYGKDKEPGAPMASEAGISTETYLRICWLMGQTGVQPASIDAAEIAPACDREQGGRARDILVGGISRQLGMGYDPEYHFGYDPLGE